MWILNISIYILSVFLPHCECARILAVIPTPCYSHQVTFQPIWRELSLRGHQVTTLTTNPINDPTLTNLTEIDLHPSYDIWDKHITKISSTHFLYFFIAVSDVLEKIAHYQLSHPQVQRLINSDTEKFDLVMLEFNFMQTHAFAKKFNAPTVLISSLDVFSNIRKVMGSPSHPIMYPDPVVPLPKNPTLKERLVGVIYKIVIEFGTKHYYNPKQQLLQDKYFGKNYPTAEELRNDVSLVLVKSDPIFNGVQALTPTIVQFGGGIHRTAPKPLPNDLKILLDGAKDGFIYFSLGSTIKSKDLSEKTLNVIIKAFSELPYLVLWKFEKDDLPNKPKNVRTFKWLPQQDVLRHPNIKLFITQGGLQSTDEAIYDRVPMLGMPIFGDQEGNVAKMVAMRLMVSVNYKTMNEEELKAAVFEVINNPEYKETITKLVTLALDEPMTGLEKAVWWTEYVIRHNGTKHLRSPVLDIPFYQYYLLDVIAVILGVVFVLIFSLRYIVMLLLTLVPKKKSKTN
ncbi:hypothetical protein FQR65_LT00898 [Abscondita terminalis]|nr:hypothetical protein FQR65_LT00898 [Abscondita terminalis]